MEKTKEQLEKELEVALKMEQDFVDFASKKHNNDYQQGMLDEAKHIVSILKTILEKKDGK